MAQAYRKLGQGTLTGLGTQDTLYTVPAGTETIVKEITLVNFSGSTRTVKMWHDGVANSNYILPAASITAGGWANFDGVITMDPGDTLRAEASAAASITYTVYGLETA